MPQAPIRPSMVRSMRENNNDEYHSPGVYVRASKHGHSQPASSDLDMLWSGNRGLGRDERSSLLVFIGGCLLGAFLTAAGFMLVINKPQGTLNDLTPTQATSAEQSPEAATDPAAQGTETNLPNGSAARTGKASKLATGGLGGQTYVIQSGDSLQSIAQRFYGSSEDKYVLKIQEANRLESPHMIMIDQTLVIPPA
ncbi:MAG: LysM peptidoglycan-binding domain-containing protein [Vampirovibrionales bacterium]|nr:LysM peptidoglycan-binding domain-containing protein [Vampirovibrionales bacterium]